MKEYNSLKIVLYIVTMFVLYPSIHLTLTFVQIVFYDFHAVAIK